MILGTLALIISGAVLMKSKAKLRELLMTSQQFWISILIMLMLLMLEELVKTNDLTLQKLLRIITWRFRSIKDV